AGARLVARPGYRARGGRAPAGQDGWAIGGGKWAEQALGAGKGEPGVIGTAVAGGEGVWADGRAVGGRRSARGGGAGDFSGAVTGRRGAMLYR
ncbi:hypothetical protein B1218_38240, partial [Pseudomonas ogarae]